MNTNTNSWLSRKKWILIMIGIPVLIGAWWEFRPEKLFITQKVNEAAPASLGSGAQPIFTGKLEGKIHATSGRATIYKAADGTRYLLQRNGLYPGGHVPFTLVLHSGCPLLRHVRRSPLDLDYGAGVCEVGSTPQSCDHMRARCARSSTMAIVGSC